MIKKFRNWQVQCLQKLEESFSRGSRHFLCLAATASGKTLLSVEFGKRLLEADLIDMVLVFCPSLEIQKGIQRTFREHVGSPFDGSLASKGHVMTYQAMLTQSESFWEMLEKYRVLVIFDEIHHCAGTPYSKRNSWGTRILNHIAKQARFILSLSGTPWRTDKLPISTAIYDKDTKIQCDFSYGLTDAVNDGVCRMPNITLVDNTQISVESVKDGKKTFGSFADALINSDLKYSHILTNLIAQKYILKRGIKKLDELRKNDPGAGGLVVASSVGHAVELAELLQYEFHQSTAIVSYLHSESSEIIDEFKNGNTRWIVSIGMISEGTDIPRLQVCCHLSNVLTEMYFRQILGRILRKTKGYDTEEIAWLYTFSEPTLCEYVRRLHIDIPDMEVNFEGMKNGRFEDEFGINPDGVKDSKKDSKNDSKTIVTPLNVDIDFNLDEDADKAKAKDSFDDNSHEQSDQNTDDLHILLRNLKLKDKYFLEQLVSFYDFEEAVNV